MSPACHTGSTDTPTASPHSPPSRAARGRSRDVMTLRGPISCDVKDILNLKAGRSRSLVDAVDLLRFPGLQPAGWRRRRRWRCACGCGRSTAGRRRGPAGTGDCATLPAGHLRPGRAVRVAPTPRSRTRCFPRTSSDRDGDRKCAVVEKGRKC